MVVPMIYKLAKLPPFLSLGVLHVVFSRDTFLCRAVWLLAGLAAGSRGMQLQLRSHTGPPNKCAIGSWWNLRDWGYGGGHAFVLCVFTVGFTVAGSGVCREVMGSLLERLFNGHLGSEKGAVSVSENRNLLLEI